MSEAFLSAEIKSLYEADVAKMFLVGAFSDIRVLAVLFLPFLCVFFLLCLKSVLRARGGAFG